MDWLLVLSGSIATLLLGVGHVLRVRYVSRRIRKRIELEAAEELRNARELPDKLLQAIHGLVLTFHSAIEQLEETHPVRPMLKMVLQRADALLIDGRKQVEELDGRAEAHETASACQSR